MSHYYRARYILDGTRFREDAVLEVEGDRIGGIHATSEIDDEQSVEDLGDVAIVPGLVNAHSHAFQRAIRGRTEYLVTSRAEDDFWTWREQMYGAALELDADEIESVARMAFLEMALSGITTVGEFHYLHNDIDGKPYDDPNELANRVIRAARDIGIRISLLRVAYGRAGFERERNPRQRRFLEPDAETFLERTVSLESAWSDDDRVTIGAAPHSIRAVPFEWLRDIGEAAHENDWPLHIHACEQWREIEESLEEYGAPPIIVFEEMGILDERMTLVHGTHLCTEEFDVLERARPTVCACPTTERNLGDGFLPASHLVGNRVPIALGSDSQTNIDLWEEMRLVEYNERLNHNSRNVLPSVVVQVEEPPDDHIVRTEDLLWPMATEHGARSLRLPVGELSAGKLADFVTVDLKHVILRGTSRDTLLAHLALSATSAVVRDVFVGGECIVSEGRHARQDEIFETFEGVMRTE